MKQKEKDKRKINRERKYIAKVSKETGLSPALLFYAAKFGFMGLFTKKQ